MFCRKCGQQLDEGAKFCKDCGTKVSGKSENNQVVIPKLKNEPVAPVTVSDAAPAGAGAINPAASIVAAQGTAGEFALPQVQTVVTQAVQQSLWQLLGESTNAMLHNLVTVYKNKRKLTVILVLLAIWVAIGYAQRKGIDSSLLVMLANVTAAGGDLFSGTVAKAMVTAVACSIFAGNAFFSKVFSGLGRITSGFGGAKGSWGGLLLGMGAALCFCTLFGAESIDKTIPVTGILLSLQANGGNGYFKKILGAVLPKKKNGASAFMSGLTLGFGFELAASSYAVLAGGACLAAGLVITVFNVFKKGGAQA